MECLFFVSALRKKEAKAVESIFITVWRTNKEKSGLMSAVQNVEIPYTSNYVES